VIQLPSGWSDVLNGLDEESWNSFDIEKKAIIRGYLIKLYMECTHGNAYSYPIEFARLALSLDTHVSRLLPLCTAAFADVEIEVPGKSCSSASPGSSVSVPVLVVAC